MGPAADGDWLLALHVKTVEAGSAGETQPPLPGDFHLPGGCGDPGRRVDPRQHDLRLPGLGKHPELDGVAPLVVHEDHRHFDIREADGWTLAGVTGQILRLGQRNQQTLAETWPTYELQSSTETSLLVPGLHPHVDGIHQHLVGDRYSFVRLVQMQQQERLLILPGRTVQRRRG